MKSLLKMSKCIIDMLLNYLCDFLSKKIFITVGWWFKLHR